MNDKIKLIIGISLCVVFVAGAAFLYNYLGSKAPEDNLVTGAPESFKEVVGKDESKGEVSQNTTEPPKAQEDTPNDDNAETPQPPVEDEPSAEEKPEDKYTDTESGEEQSHSSLAPDFTVTDANGAKVKLSQFKGKPVIINLWASWCPPCKSEMPVFEKLCKKYDGEIVFMMINLTTQDDISDAKGFIKDSGYTFPVYFDETGEVGQKYYTPGIPATFFVDAAGGAVAYVTGAINEATLIKGIEMIK